MITASINFLENNVTADLTRKEFELASDLKKTGILIPINNMSLNNTLTLQVHLTPNDEQGEVLYNLIDTNTDTLGTVRKLCRNFYCLNSKHRAEFIEKVENGEITTVTDGITVAKKMREERTSEIHR